MAAAFKSLAVLRTQREKGHCTNICRAVSRSIRVQNGVPHRMDGTRCQCVLVND